LLLITVVSELVWQHRLVLAYAKARLTARKRYACASCHWKMRAPALGTERKYLPVQCAARAARATLCGVFNDPHMLHARTVFFDDFLQAIHVEEFDVWRAIAAIGGRIPRTL